MKYLVELRYNRLDGFILITSGVLIGEGHTIVALLVMTVGMLVSGYLEYRYKFGLSGNRYE